MASTLEPQKVLDLFPRALDTGSQYGTITIRKGGVASEVTTLRADGDYLDGRRPEAVQFGTSLKVCIVGAWVRVRGCGRVLINGLWPRRCRKTCCGGTSPSTRWQCTSGGARSSTRGAGR